MIRLNCFLQIEDMNHKEEVVAAAKRLVEASLKQDGCIAYDFFESATRPDVMMFCETWKDQPTLDAHGESYPFIKEVGVISSFAKMKLEKFIF